MRRSAVLIAGPHGRAGRRLAGGLGRLRLEPPRGARDHARPNGRQHRRLRLHGAGRPGQPDGGRQLDPARGARGRPVLRQARSEGALLRQDRQHRRRLRGRGLPLAVQEQVPQPELVPVRGADGRPRSTIRTSTSSRRTTSTRRPTRTGSWLKRTRRIAHDVAGRPGQRRPEDDPELRPGRGRRDHPAAAAAARRSSARPTTRSSSTSARSSTASTSTSPAGRTSASATRAAARTTSRATTRTRSCCRCPRREVTRRRQARSPT